MPSDLPGKLDIFGRYRLPVAPHGIGPDGVGDGDSLFSFRRFFRRREPVFNGRKLCAQHADQLPILVVGGDGAARHGQHVAFGHHRIDAGMEGGRELCNPDDQFVLGRAGTRRQRHDYPDNQHRPADHEQSSRVVNPDSKDRDYARLVQEPLGEWNVEDFGKHTVKGRANEQRGQKVP